jgi:carbon-monoxide dehydrogenase medium subunit
LTPQGGQVKAAPFAYHVPTSVEDACALLGEHGDEAKVIAGGQSLVPLLAMRLTRFEHLIDLAKIAELRGVTHTDGGIRVAAMTTQATIERDDDLHAAAPLLARATRYIGHLQIRNRGTIGGSLAHADPAAEYPAIACVLDAEIELAGASGTRRVPARDFFVSTWTTAAQADEVVVAAYLPSWGAGSGFSIHEVARRHGDFAMAGVACAVNANGGKVTRAAIGFFGMGSTPLRASAAEAALVGSAASDIDAAEIANGAVADLDPPTDLHASAAHRLRMATALAERSIVDALEEAVRV